MLISKVKLEELRTKLHSHIYSNYEIPPYYSHQNWSDSQISDLESWRSMLQYNLRTSMTVLVDEILNTLYLQEDMEKDLKLR